MSCHFDGNTKVSGVKNGNKRKISLDISPELLIKVDQPAADIGQSRAGLINMAIYRAGYLICPPMQRSRRSVREWRLILMRAVSDARYKVITYALRKRKNEETL